MYVYMCIYIYIQELWARCARPPPLIQHQRSMLETLERTIKSTNIAPAKQDKGAEHAANCGANSLQEKWKAPACTMADGKKDIIQNQQQESPETCLRH